jgi:hypothetical protein
MTTLTHSWFMTMRHLRNLARQPWWIAITLVQPVIWLLLFGAVFKATADIPGFVADSYIDYLTPGIVVMTGAFAGGWAGMGVIEDLNRGVIDRFLVSPGGPPGPHQRPAGPAGDRVGDPVADRDHPRPAGRGQLPRRRDRAGRAGRRLASP